MDLRKRLENIRLNKSGTIGTEKIARPLGGGAYENRLEFKFGKAGKVSVPTGKLTYQRPFVKPIVKPKPKPRPYGRVAPKGGWGYRFK